MRAVYDCHETLMRFFLHSSHFKTTEIAIDLAGRQGRYAFALLGAR
jgi:hypothetical protein